MLCAQKPLSLSLSPVSTQFSYNLQARRNLAILRQLQLPPPLLLAQLSSFLPSSGFRRACLALAREDIAAKRTSKEQEEEDDDDDDKKLISGMACWPDRPDHRPFSSAFNSENRALHDRLK